MTRRRLPLAAALLLCAPAAPGAGEDEPAPRLTLDWIFSEDGKTAAAVPEHAWLAGGQAVLYDTRRPKAARTLERLDPDSGARTALVDAGRALDSLQGLRGATEPEPELGWPDALDPHGRFAAYEKRDGVFLLDLARAEFTAVGAAARSRKSPRFAPDGAKLAFVQDNDLYVRFLATGEERRLTTTGSSTLKNGTLSWVYWEEIFARTDLGFWWAPDSSAIAYLETDESGVGLMHFVDFAPELPRLIEQRYPKAGSPNPKVRAGVVRLDTAQTTWIDLGAHPHEYLARVTWLEDGGRLAVQTLDRPQTTLDVYLADAASGAVRHLLRETNPGWINLHDDLRFLAGRDELLWVSERSGHAHFYRYGLDGRLRGPVTAGPWALREAARVFWQRRAAAFVDEDQGLLYFTALEKSPLEIHLYRTALDGGAEAAPERLTRSDGTHAVQFSPDGRFYLDAHSGYDRMPALELRTADGRLVQDIAPPRPETLERFDPLPRELFTIPARDGFPLPAAWILPRGFDPDQRYPVVLYVYGGPSAPIVADAFQGRARDCFEQMLADRGFIALRVDNRSSSGQSKSLENLILHDGYGKTELDDLLDAVAWLKAQPFVDPANVGIWGWSGGGSYTLQAMTSCREFKAGIAVAAVSDWRYYDTRWAEAFMKRPADNPEGYERTSHARRAAQLHGRLLLVHGTYDDNVHPQNAWRFADELVKAGITFDMMIYPMRQHGIADDAAQKHLYATMLEFWEHHLK